MCLRPRLRRRPRHPTASSRVDQSGAVAIAGLVFSPRLGKGPLSLGFAHARLNSADRVRASRSVNSSPRSCPAPDGRHQTTLAFTSIDPAPEPSTKARREFGPTGDGRSRRSRRPEADMSSTCPANRQFTRGQRIRPWRRRSPRVEFSSVLWAAECMALRTSSRRRLGFIAPSAVLRESRLVSNYLSPAVLGPWPAVQGALVPLPSAQPSRSGGQERGICPSWLSLVPERPMERGLRMRSNPPGGRETGGRGDEQDEQQQGLGLGAYAT